MDEDIKKIVNQVFTVSEGAIIEKMLEEVNKDMSDSSQAKRISALDLILNDAIK